MRGLARISFADGAFLVSAETPYEHELLFDHAVRYTQQRGRLTLEVNRREWTLSLGAGEGLLCTTCGHGLDRIVYARAGRVLCRRCARRDWAGNAQLSDKRPGRRKPAIRKERSRLNQQQHGP